MKKNKFKVSGLRFKVTGSCSLPVLRSCSLPVLRSCCLTVLFCASIFANAQSESSVSYLYDDSGNRTCRTINMKSPAMTPPPQDSTENVVEDPENEKSQEIYTDVLLETLITIYPNPTRGLLAVKIANLPQQSVSSLTLFDMQGKVIIQQSLSNENRLDISAQSAGTYIMQIAVGDEVTSWKIIKQ